MWILPKSLISAFAQDTEALTLDFGECSQTCAQSLTVRSKPSQWKTFLREWKRGNWMRLRSGAISSPSLGQSFLGWWTSSLAATRVSHSVQPGSEPEQTTQDIFGPTSQAAFDFFGPESASLRMSKGTSRWDSPASSVIWKRWVIKCRGEYSVRLNAVRLTSASECLSWPTATTRDWKDTITGTHPPSRPLLGQQTLGQAVSVMSGLAAQGNHSTLGSRPESWATPRTKDAEGWMMNKARLADGKPEDTLTGQALNSDKNNGKLNPRWVETLMGLPVGWTMPTCASPVIPGLTS